VRRTHWPGAPAPGHDGGSAIDTLTSIPLPLLIIIGVCLMFCVLWVARRAGGPSSGGAAVWILGVFFLAICVAGALLLAGSIRFSGFDLKH
jgi:cytochrome c oxidase assembly factor CtaG